MTKRIGNKDQAQHRSKQEKKEYHLANKVREAARQAAARARNSHQVRHQPMAASRPAAV